MNLACVKPLKAVDKYKGEEGGGKRAVKGVSLIKV
jgi:hypothetical protein